MHNEIRNELENHIIPFWDSLIDRENGGFFSFVSHDLIIGENTFRSCILHSRILWFYSNCYLVLKNPKYLETAKHCYDFMIKFIDKESHGVFWSVNSRGVPANPMKHVYNQAFFVYALSSYYDASKDSTALNNAMRVFETIEVETADEVAYRECFDRDWNLADNDELSENGIQAEKTMNTVLHLIEAYTELYRVGKNDDVLTRLQTLLGLMYNRIFDSNRNQLRVFFDSDMKEKGNVHSYGHDIEASWLIGRAIDVAGDAISDVLVTALRDMNRKLVDKIDSVAFCESGTGSMYYENVDGFLNRTRTWWVQSEGVVGFLEAYRLYGEQKYLDRATQLWEYIKVRMIDSRPGGEWFNELDNDHNPKPELPIASEWKCPYHNGRMCLEVIKFFEEKEVS